MILKLPQEYFFVLKMNKGTLFLLFSIVLLGAGVAIGGAFLQGGTKDIVLALRTSEQFIPISLEVEGTVYKMSVESGSNVYDAMIQAQKISNLSFEGSEFSKLGFFVEEINGLGQNPRAGKYWIYYLNGRKAEVGISVYKLQMNDVISWKYEDEE